MPVWLRFELRYRLKWPLAYPWSLCPKDRFGVCLATEQRHRHTKTRQDHKNTNVIYTPALMKTISHTTLTLTCFSVLVRGQLYGTRRLRMTK
jgi:hypothetical protein